MKKLLLISLALTLCAARPSFAEFVSETDASVGHCEGCETDPAIVDLVMDGGEARVVGLVPDVADPSLYVGFGEVNYAFAGVSIHEAGASFKVRFVPSPCSDCLVNRFPSTIDVYNAAGGWILSASKVRFDTSTPDPTAKYAACYVGNLPASLLARIKRAYR